MSGCREVFTAGKQNECHIEKWAGLGCGMARVQGRRGSRALLTRQEAIRGGQNDDARVKVPTPLGGFFDTSRYVTRACWAALPEAVCEYSV
jgi:hypothetical protein